jgi:hypothetical protein
VPFWCGWMDGRALRAPRPSFFIGTSTPRHQESPWLDARHDGVSRPRKTACRRDYSTTGKPGRLIDATGMFNICET